MGMRSGGFRERVNAAVDWFIPANLQHTPEMLSAVRMFLFSHLFGPFLGLTVGVSMVVIDGHIDATHWVYIIAVAGFWPFPFLLRLTGWYVPLALVSIENLMFCIFWGCYQYGGVSSPFIPWLVTVPLLAFFYLPERSTRIGVTVLIVANLALFNWVYSVLGFRETVAPDGMVVLGLVSTLCASVYVSMMALYFASIVSSQRELEQEVQRHQTTELSLREATGLAQRALLAKSEFLAKMSHELKNPLNSIIGYSELLMENLGGAPTQKSKDLTSIRSAGHRLLELINDLLDLSKLEAGKVGLDVEEFELSEWFEITARSARPSFAENGNEFVVRAPAAGRVTCDLQKLQRIVDGLLSNAAKFTRDGRVTFWTSIWEDSFVVSIEDTGVGIPEARLAGLFETFGRSEGETASKYVEEVRLGLPLAYRYCQLMGGALAVQSRVGRGSTVTVTLPRRSASARAPADAALDLQGQAA